MANVSHVIVDEAHERSEVSTVRLRARVRIRVRAKCKLSAPRWS